MSHSFRRTRDMPIAISDPNLDIKMIKRNAKSKLPPDRVMHAMDEYGGTLSSPPEEGQVTVPVVTAHLYNKSKPLIDPKMNN